MYVVQNTVDYQASVQVIQARLANLEQMYCSSKLFPGGVRSHVCKRPLDATITWMFPFREPVWLYFLSQCVLFIIKIDNYSTLCWDKTTQETFNSLLIFYMPCDQHFVFIASCKSFNMTLKKKTYETSIADVLVGLMIINCDHTRNFSRKNVYMYTCWPLDLHIPS